MWPFLSPSGLLGGFVRPGGSTTEEMVQGVVSGVFVGAPGEELHQVNCDSTSAEPIFIDEDTLVLVHERANESQFSIFRMSQRYRTATPLCTIPGSVEQLVWDVTRQRLVALVAEPGSDTGAVWSGRRHARPEMDPEVNQGHTGAHQLWSIALDNPTPNFLGPEVGSIWEFDVALDGSIVGVYSADEGEVGWYSPLIVRLGDDAKKIEPLYRPTEQVSHVAIEQSSGRVAFVEAWCSDRGLLAGQVVILGSNGQVERRVTSIPADVTWVRFDNRGRLFFAGWQDLSSSYGYLDGEELRESVVEPVSIVGAPPLPSFALSMDGAVRLTTWSDAQTPPSVVMIDDQGGGRTTWVTTTSLPIPPHDVHEAAWSAPDGLEIHGLLLVPHRELAEAGNGRALVIHIHGGPSWLFHHGYNPADAHRLLESGFSVLLPNPRGSTGRGAEFGGANRGDPGGKEMDDVLGGARWAIEQGLVPEGKAAVMGASYGGYLSAVAAMTRPVEVRAAVVRAGIGNWGSARNTGNNHRGYDLIIGGAPNSDAARQLCLDRSPIYQDARSIAPTLLLHGEEDRCVPASQSHEMYTCMRTVGAEVEMVTYPREGHQIVEPKHVEDVWARTLRWLSRWQDPV
jgi:dipeptidyl aminopeptidase/acylaminoacyl peptidase